MADSAAPWPVLHEVVREQLETFLDQGRGRGGDGYPRFIEHEYRRYLDCGILCHGFARVRCGSCGEEKLVAFSCKGRFCPSCQARRMCDTAAGGVSPGRRSSTASSSSTRSSAPGAGAG